MLGKIGFVSTRFVQDCSLSHEQTYTVQYNNNYTTEYWDRCYNALFKTCITEVSLKKLVKTCMCNNIDKLSPALSVVELASGPIHGK